MGLADIVPDQIYGVYDSLSNRVMDFYEDADEFCWNVLDSIEDKGVPVASLWENTNISPVVIPVVFLVIIAFLVFPLVVPVQSTFSATVLFEDVLDYSDFKANVVLESTDGKIFLKKLMSPEKNVVFEDLLKGEYSVDLKKDKKSVCPKFTSSKILFVEGDSSLLVFDLKACLDEAVDLEIKSSDELRSDSSSGTVRVLVVNKINASVIEGAFVELKDYETKTIIESGITDSSGHVNFKTKIDGNVYVLVSKEGFVDKVTNEFKVKIGSIEKKTVSMTLVDQAEKGMFNVCVKAGTKIARHAKVTVFNEEDQEVASGTTLNNGCITFREIPTSSQVYANVNGFLGYSDYRIKKLERIFEGGKSNQEIVLFKGVPLRIKVIASGVVITDKVKVTLWSSLDEKIRGFESDGSLSVRSLPWTESIMLKPNFKYNVVVTGVPSKFKEFKSRVYSMNAEGVDLSVELDLVVPPENLIIKDVVPNHAVAFGENFVLSAKVFAGTNPVKNAVVKYKIGNSTFKPMAYDNNLLAYKTEIKAPLTDESLLFTIKAEWDLLGVHLVAEKNFAVVVSMNPEQELSLVFSFGNDDEEYNGNSYTRNVVKGVNAGPLKVQVVKSYIFDGKTRGKILDPNDGVDVFVSSVQFDFSNKKLTKYSKSERVFVLDNLNIPSNPEFNQYQVNLRAVQTSDGGSATGSASFKIRPVNLDSIELVFANVSTSPMVVKPGEEVEVEAIVKWAGSVTSEAIVKLNAPDFFIDGAKSNGVKMVYRSQTGRYALVLTAPTKEGKYLIDLDALFNYSTKEYKTVFKGLPVVVSENPEQVLSVAIKNENGYYEFMPLRLTKPIDAKIKDIGIRIFDFEGHQLKQVDNVTVKYREKSKLESDAKDANYKTGSFEWVIEEIIIPNTAGIDLNFTISAIKPGVFENLSGENYININVVPNEQNDCNATSCTSDEAARYLWNKIDHTWNNAEVDAYNWVNPASSREIKIKLIEPMAFSVFTEAAFKSSDAIHSDCVSSSEDLCFNSIEYNISSKVLDSENPKGNSVVWRLGDTSKESKLLTVFAWKKLLGEESDYDIVLEKNRSGLGPCLTKIAYGDQYEKKVADAIASVIGISKTDDVKTFDELKADPNNANYNIINVWSAQQKSPNSDTPQNPESVNLFNEINGLVSENPVFYSVNGPGSEKSVFIKFGGKAFIGESYVVYSAQVAGKTWFVVAGITDNALNNAKEKFNDLITGFAQICDTAISEKSPIVGDFSNDSDKMEVYNTVVLFDDMRGNKNSEIGISLFSDFTDDAFKTCINPSEWNNFRKTVIPISSARSIFGSDSAIMNAFSEYHKVVIGHPSEDSLLRYLDGNCGVEWVYGSFSAFTGSCSTKREGTVVMEGSGFPYSNESICDSGNLVSDYGFNTQSNNALFVMDFLDGSYSDFINPDSGSNLIGKNVLEFDFPMIGYTGNIIECCRKGSANVTKSASCDTGCYKCNNPSPPPNCGVPSTISGNALKKEGGNFREVNTSCSFLPSEDSDSCGSCAPPGSALYNLCNYSCNSFVECNQCYPQYVGGFWGLKNGEKIEYSVDSWKQIGKSGSCAFGKKDKKLVLLTGMSENAMNEITKSGVSCGGVNFFKNKKDSNNINGGAEATCSNVEFERGKIDDSNECQGGSSVSSCGVQVYFDSTGEKWVDWVENNSFKAKMKIVVENTSAVKVSGIVVTAEMFEGRFLFASNPKTFDSFDLEVGAKKEFEVEYARNFDNKNDFIDNTKGNDSNFASVFKQPYVFLNVTACNKEIKIKHKTRTVYGAFAIYNDSDVDVLAGFLVNLEDGVEDLKQKLGVYKIEGEDLKEILPSFENKCGGFSYCNGTDSKNSVFKIYSTYKLDGGSEDKRFNSEQFLIYKFLYSHTDSSIGSKVRYNMFFAPRIDKNNKNDTCKDYLNNKLCLEKNFIDFGDFGCDALKTENVWWCDDLDDYGKNYKLDENTLVKTHFFEGFTESATNIGSVSDAVTYQPETGTCSPNINNFCKDFTYWKKNEVTSKELDKYLEGDNNLLFDDSGSVPTIVNFKNFGNLNVSDCNATYVKEPMNELYIV